MNACGRESMTDMLRRRIRITISAVVILLLGLIVMADCGSGESSRPVAHIVYTESPRDEQPEAYHIRTLASVLGSEEAAKEALLYSYKNAATGFSAKLTPEQVADISKQPGVIQVVPSKMYQLHSGTMGLR